jgi:hypothetical protein
VAVVVYKSGIHNGRKNVFNLFCNFSILKIMKKKTKTKTNLNLHLICFGASTSQKVLKKAVEVISKSSYVQRVLLLQPCSK